MATKLDYLLTEMARLRGLPTLPEAALKLNQLLTSGTASARQVGDLIATDPANATKVLRVANSALYGLRKQVTTIPHAIAVIGFEGVHSIVLGEAVFKAFGKGELAAGFTYRDFWRHSVACASTARLLAGRERKVNPMEAFMAGLLHDLGTAFLGMAAPPAFREARARVAAGTPLVEAEVAAFGASHAEFGALLLERWNMPAIYVEPARHHLSPGAATPEHARRTELVRAADIMAQQLAIGTDGEPLPDYDTLRWALDLAGVPQAESDAVLRDAAERARAHEAALLG
jgi:HD-like signal output (HDOD) protein